MSEEADIQAAIQLRYGARAGFRMWRCNTGVAKNLKTGKLVRFGVVGQADLQGVLAPNARHVSIEVKAPGRRQTPAQRAWQELIEQHGGLYILARSVSDVSRVLDPLLPPVL